MLIFGDLDEIPNPLILERANQYLNKGKRIIHCAQIPFYGFLNYRDVSGKLLSYAGEYPFIFSPKWLGSVIFKKNLLEQNTMTSLRDPSQKEFGKRLSNGGWHFSYCGGNGSDFISRITYKLESAAHQEFNNSKILNGILTRLERNEDFLGRSSTTFLRKKRIAKLRKVRFNSCFPKYIVENHNKYKHLIHDYH